MAVKLRQYEVKVSAHAEDGTAVELGTVRVHAADRQEARRMGIEAAWDARLTCAGLRATAGVQPAGDRVAGDVRR